MNNNKYFQLIRDENFIRGKAPMTKQEIREALLLKLKLFKGCSFLDIGSGTGAVAIDCARLINPGKVITIEKNIEAHEICLKNIKKFRTDNVEAIHGNASEVIPGLNMEFDSVFTGGSGTEKREIIKLADKVLRPGGIIAATCIQIESLNDFLKLFKENGFLDIEFFMYSVSRGEKIGKGHFFRPLNPVYIIKGIKNGK